MATLSKDSGSVSVVGAGPAGLAAAMELARHGVCVTVYEQHPRVGGRFHGDFQGLENWTTDEDVPTWLDRLGIQLSCPHRPTREVTVVDPSLSPHHLQSGRPLLYLIERGPGVDSLDRSLWAQATRLGIKFRMGRRVRPEELTPPIVVATGPQDTQAAVAGIIADTPYPDQVVALLRNSLAPKCYAYCVIWHGRATVATALARDFRTAGSCFHRARAAFATLGLREFWNERRFGGRANICLGRTLQTPRELRVGEAAGLQDYLFGFGLRYALLSGHLAARALLTGEPYDALVKRHLEDRFRAGFVNRFVYDRLGDRGYRWLTRWAGGIPDVRRRAVQVYSLTRFHRALWPVAAALAHRNRGSFTSREDRRRVAT